MTRWCCPSNEPPRRKENRGQHPSDPSHPWGAIQAWSECVTRQGHTPDVTYLCGLLRIRFACYEKITISDVQAASDVASGKGKQAFVTKRRLLLRIPPALLGIACSCDISTPAVEITLWARRDPLCQQPSEPAFCFLPSDLCRLPPARNTSEKTGHPRPPVSHEGTPYRSSTPRKKPHFSTAYDLRTYTVGLIF